MDTRRRNAVSRGLTVLELTAKTQWIRDTLEPYIAQNGPEPLSPDTVLDLAAFFSQLLSQTTTVASETPIFPGLGSKIASAPLITLDDIRASRIHRALLVITSRGTRWPGKLIDVCDMLMAAWSDRFGDLNMIKPLLYEKGGRLYEVREEKEMSRHALLVKWLSDRNSLVSPLRALENGHLEFKPSQWWIHPIFAFYDGIIDSPDPQGGITADADGAYAIMLTGYDESDSLTPETFTYHIRKGDKGKHRLLGAFLPHKQSIRVLRSHTLHSMWSPVAGLRYDGLERYKITSFSVSADVDGTVRYRVRLQRDADQTPMKDVRKHPTAEEVDDYIEYKRLRLFRSNKTRDPTKRAPKADKILGVIPAMQDFTLDSDQEIEATSLLLRDAANFWISQDSIPQAARYRGNIDESQKNTFDRTEDSPIGTLDGAPLRPRCSNPLAHTPVEFRKDTTRSREQIKKVPRPMGPLRNCCPSQSDGTEDVKRSSGDKRKDSAFDFTDNHRSGFLHHEGSQMINPELSVDHASMRILRDNINALAQITKNRGTMSRTFFEDLKGMLGIVNQWEKENLSKHGSVDRCIWEVTEAIYELRYCLDTVWDASWVDEGGQDEAFRRLSEYETS